MIKKLGFGIVVLLFTGGVVFFTASRVSKTVRVSRVFDAPIDRVWANWTDADAMKRWWSPKGYTAPLIKNDVRVGGTFLFSMKSPAGEVHYNAGVYTDIALNKKILAKMSFADETGKPISASAAGLPGRWPMEIEVLTEFTELDNGQKTRVEITERGIPMIMYVFAKMGWEQQFDKFEAIVLALKSDFGG